MKNLIFLILALLAWPGGGCGAAKAAKEAGAEAVVAPAAPDGEWAVVNTSCVFMRGEASYTSENVSQSRMGTPVQVLARTGYWVKIRTPEPYEGWVNELTLAPYPADYRSCRRYICIAEYSFVYAEPSMEAARLSDVRMSDIVRCAVAGKDEAAAGRGGKGARNDGWAAVQLWDGRSGWIPSGDVADFEKWMADSEYRAQGWSQKSTENATNHSELAAEIVTTARRFLGAPYMWGGMSAGLFDCSGLVGFCYFMAGIQLPRDASQQIGCGVPVAFEDMQAGDLVFFGEKRVGHVALCTGPGRIIHSSQIVRENSLVAGEPDYYGRNILGIRRIIGNLPEQNFIRNSSLYFNHGGPAQPEQNRQ